MSRRKIRLATVAAIVGGFLVIGATNGFAAPPGPAVSSTRNPWMSKSAPLGVPGVVAVSRSEASQDHAEWSAVWLQGESLIGSNEDGWNGQLAPAGDVVDQVNDQSCADDGGPLADRGTELCVALLPHDVESNYFASTAEGSIAQVFLSTDPGEPDPYVLGIGVLNSGAFTTPCLTGASASVLYIGYAVPLLGTGLQAPGALGSLQNRCVTETPGGGEVVTPLP